MTSDLLLRLNTPLHQNHIYTCFVVQKLHGYYHFVPRHSWHDDLYVLTITELKFIIENCNNKKVFPFAKIDKYINELRTSKR